MQCHLQQKIGKQKSNENENRLGQCGRCACGPVAVMAVVAALATRAAVATLIDESSTAAKSTPLNYHLNFQNRSKNDKIKSNFKNVRSAKNSIIFSLGGHAAPIVRGDVRRSRAVVALRLQLCSGHAAAATAAAAAAKTLTSNRLRVEY